MCGGRREEDAEGVEIEPVRKALQMFSAIRKILADPARLSSLALFLSIALAVMAAPERAHAAAPTPTCAGQAATIFKPDGSPGRLRGTEGDDVIVGSIGRDNVEALGGDDLICTVDGKDSILGGTGTDRIYARYRRRRGRDGAGTGDEVWGGDGNDVVSVDSVNSAAHGEVGNNHLISLGDIVFLEGGDGNDVLEGGRRTDTIDGGTGNDRIDTGDGRSNSVDAGEGDDNIVGGDGADRINGDAGNDSVLAGKGNDKNVHGGDGNDDIEGGAGTDVVFGDAGDDILDTDTGNGDTPTAAPTTIT